MEAHAFLLLYRFSITLALGVSLNKVSFVELNVKAPKNPILYN
jgi:hypothetical protein